MYFKLIDKTRKDGWVDIFMAPRGSQIMYNKIEDIVGMKPHPLTDVPYALELDGWADDDAFPGDVYETEDFVVECLSEEEYLEYQD
jgi:hypothetical protein